MATNWQKAVSQEDFNELNAKVGNSTDDETKVTLFGKLAKVFQSVSSGKSKIATAITGKGIATLGSDTFAKMAGNIDLIKMVSSGDAGKILAGQSINGINGTATNDANALAGDLLSGKSGYVKGLKVNGTMANKGAISQALAINGTYTIPPGYHNGSGKVTQSITTKAAQTYTPTTANQTIGAGQYLNGAQTIAGSGNLVPGNIKQGVNLFGVVGTMAETRFATKGITTATDAQDFYVTYPGGIQEVPLMIFAIEEASTTGVDIWRTSFWWNGLSKYNYQTQIRDVTTSGFNLYGRWGRTDYLIYFIWG